MGTDDPTSTPDPHVVESAVAGAVAGLTVDDDAPVAAPLETASQRFANYCKGVGSLIGGVGAIAAIVLSLVALLRTPSEPTAKKGYAAVDTVVKQLSVDVQKEHDSRVHADELLAKDVAASREQLQLVVQLLTPARPRTPVRPRPVTKSGVPAVAPTPALPASQPAALLRDLTYQVQMKPAATVKKLSSPRPPLRKLPPLP